jgi:hypothetical protein
LLLFALLIGIPVATGLLALDLFQVRAALQTARASLGDAVVAISEVDLDRASLALETAENELARARDSSSGPLWAVASVTPIVRHPTTTTQQIVEVASAAVDVGQTALTEGEPIIRDGLAIGVEDGRIDLEPLRDAGDLLASLPVERLTAARDQLAEPLAGWVPQVLWDARAESLQLATRTIDSVTDAREVTAVLPGFLGADGPRRYFVGVQTSAELRGTGGLIGFWGILSADDGQLEFGDSEVYEALDEVGGEPPDSSAVERINTLAGPLDEGVDADPEFVARYGRLAGNSFFSNVNLDPDLPSTARVALDLYTLRTGETVDGMILLDPEGLQHLLEAIGPELPVPEEVAAPLGLEATVPTDRFAQLVTVDVYDTLGSGRSDERKELLGAIGDAAVAGVLSGGWDEIAMARAVIGASVERHLQVFSEVEREQAAFVEVGVGGALDLPTDADLLAVTANNAVGGKQDVHLGHSVEAAIQLEDIGQAADGTLTATRTADIEVTVDNPLPTSGLDEYIIGNCVREDGTVGCFAGPPGWNWTWFSAWMPESTGVAAARTDNGDEVTAVSDYRAFTVVDQFQATAPESSSSFELSTIGPVPLQVTETAYVYELQWWRQSKAIPDLLDLVVQAPDGWVVDAVEVVGGGTGRGAGVHGGGQELRADVHGTAARLSGTVTAHTKLRVSLVPLTEGGQTEETGAAAAFPSGS